MQPPKHFFSTLHIFRFFLFDIILDLALLSEGQNLFASLSFFSLFYAFILIMNKSWGLFVEAEMNW